MLKLSSLYFMTGRVDTPPSLTIIIIRAQSKEHFPAIEDHADGAAWTVCSLTENNSRPANAPDDPWSRWTCFRTHLMWMHAFISRPRVRVRVQVCLDCALAFPYHHNGYSYRGFNPVGTANLCFSLCILKLALWTHSRGTLEQVRGSFQDCGRDTSFVPCPSCAEKRCVIPAGCFN
jgi:hypothetical protein